jgi:hypothetical protein
VSEEEEKDKLDAFFTRYNAGRELAMYEREKDGRFVWRAYLEYRRSGQPVPENILAILDQWAGAVLGARSVTDIPVALELSKGKKGDQHKLHWQANRRRDIVEDWFLRRFEMGLGPAAANRATAAQFGIPADTVKQKVFLWQLKNKPRQSPADAVDTEQPKDTPAPMTGPEQYLQKFWK